MRGLDWKWIGIGVAIMIALKLVAGLIIVPDLPGCIAAG